MRGAARGAWTATLSEGAFVAGAATAALFAVPGAAGGAWLSDLSDPRTTLLVFVWIFAVMLWASFAVVRHADTLARMLGEPYGTLILTLTVTVIEVSLIASVMLTGSANPTLARDTMLAVVMIVLNGMVGLALLLGGLRHGEQTFNLQGAQTFLAVLAPLATMSLILPRFTTSTAEPTLTPLQGALFAAITIALYVTFLAIQTRRHRAFFVQPGLVQPGAADADGAAGGGSRRRTAWHGTMLVLTMIPIVVLSKQIAVVIDHGIATLGAPAALGGVLIAVLVLTPEALTAFRAALANSLQRSVNICLGSALATIGLTVPAVVIIGLASGLTVVLGLEERDMVLLVLTFFISLLTFGSARTNMLQGAVHLVVFAVYVVLIFSP